MGKTVFVRYNSETGQLGGVVDTVTQIEAYTQIYDPTLLFWRELRHIFIGSQQKKGTNILLMFGLFA